MATKRPKVRTVDAHRVTVTTRVPENLAGLIGEVAHVRGQSISEAAADLLRFAMLPSIAEEIAADMSKPPAERLEAVRAIRKQYARFSDEVLTNVRILGSLIGSMDNLEAMLAAELDDAVETVQAARQ